MNPLSIRILFLLRKNALTEKFQSRRIRGHPVNSYKYEKNTDYD